MVVCNDHAGDSRDGGPGRSFRLVQTSAAASLLSQRRARDDRIWSSVPDRAAHPSAAGRGPVVRAGLGRIYFPARSSQSSVRTRFAFGRLRAGPARPLLFVVDFRLGVRMALGVLELLGGCKMDLHLSY